MLPSDLRSYGFRGVGRRSRRRTSTKSVRRHSRQFERLEPRHLLTGGLTLASIATNQFLQPGAPLQLAVNASDTTSFPIQYTVSSSNPLISAAIRQTHEYLKLHVHHDATGSPTDLPFDDDLIIELFRGDAPATVAQIVSLTNQGFYNGVIFHKVVPGFVEQAGEPTAADAGISVPTINNEVTENLRYSGAGVVGMGRTNDNDTNGSQFFITAASSPFLDYRFTIFGQLVSGESIRAAMNNVAVDVFDKPLSPVTITTASIIDDPFDVDLSLSAPLGTVGSSTITISANDGHGGTDSVTFTVNTAGNAPDPGPFITPIAPPFTAENTAATFQIPIDNQYGDNVTFLDQNTLQSVFGLNPTQPVVATETVNSVTGVVTAIPPAGFAGVTPLFVGVDSTSSLSPSTRMVPLFVTPATPTSISLLPGSDTGLSNGDGVTSFNNANAADTLQFSVGGVVPGAVVDLYDGTTLIGTAIAPPVGNAIVTTDGTHKLSDGLHQLSADQILKNLNYSVGNSTGTITLGSSISGPLAVIQIDSMPPVYISTPPFTATVGLPYNYTAQTSDSTAVTYSLVVGPPNMSINSNTGAVTWTPTPLQVGSQAVEILATDQAGNPDLQVFSVVVGAFTPLIGTFAGPPVVVGTGAKLTAQASLVGGSGGETGFITFSLTAPNGFIVDIETDNVVGEGTYTTPFGFVPTIPGVYQWVASYSGDPSNMPVSSNLGDAPELAIGPGVTIIPSPFGSTLFLVGGNTNDQVTIQHTGTSTTGGTGIQFQGQLNGVRKSLFKLLNAPTSIIIDGFGGNDKITMESTLAIPAFVTEGNGTENILLGQGENVVTAGNGPVYVRAGNGNNFLTLGNGGDSIYLGSGNNTVVAGNGNVQVHAGGGNNNVTLGNGTDYVYLGNGNNVVVTGSGTDQIQAGNGDNLIVGGLGRKTIRAGNGANILIDGSVQLTLAGDSLSQVLNDWITDNTFGVTPAEIAAIRGRLHVSYNVSKANTLNAGSGLDWFWETFALDHTNRKVTDLLN